MDDMNTNNTDINAVTPPVTPIKKNKKGLWITLCVVLGLLLLGGALAAGYFAGQTNKAQEVDTAKQTAKLEALQQAKSETKEDTVVAQKKTVTETTCNADELTLTTAENGESGAGTLSYDIVLTNSGTRTCTLGGFPGVSLVNDNGNQIGLPAERAKNYEEKKLTLAPGVKVKANVFTTNEGNYSPGECKDGATKLRVYPPNDTGYLSVVTTTTAWCPGFEVSPVLAM